jgi:hypothetical protein
MAWEWNTPVILASGVQRRMERKTPGVRRMNSMRDAGGDAGVKMGTGLITIKKSKWA